MTSAAVGRLANGVVFFSRRPLPSGPVPPWGRPGAGVSSSRFALVSALVDTPQRIHQCTASTNAACRGPWRSVTALAQARAVKAVPIAHRPACCGLCSCPEVHPNCKHSLITNMVPNMASSLLRCSIKRPLGHSSIHENAMKNVRSGSRAYFWLLTTGPAGPYVWLISGNDNQFDDHAVGS